VKPDIKVSRYGYGLSTHPGIIKQVNEDSAFLRIGVDSWNNEYALAVVADGMGGMNCGEVASQMAVELMKEWFDRMEFNQSLSHLGVEEITAALDQWLLHINEQLVTYGEINKIRIGTTLTTVFLHTNRYVVSHIGDSRGYYIKNNIKSHNANADITVPLSQLWMQQITEDHSWVATQVKQGSLTKEEARNHNRRNVLLQCLGMPGGISPHYVNGICGNEDFIMLCSDGFYSCFQEEQLVLLLEDCLKQYSSLQEMSDKLIELAVNTGAEDNLTLILLQKQEETHNASLWKKYMKFWELGSVLRKGRRSDSNTP
jgi:serine/threonine protein phosphatase PrpC